MKRNRALIMLALPVAVFLWFVGWSLYWTGSRRKRRETFTLATETCVNYLIVEAEQNIQ